MLPRDVQRLEHIAEYCDDIAETIDRFGNDFTVFCTDKAYHDLICFSCFRLGSSRVSYLKSSALLLREV